MVVVARVAWVVEGCWVVEEVYGSGKAFVEVEDTAARVCSNTIER